ncbi:hypothetical protein TMatcc_001854 [Talaromyces marneffei ATCC 18224]|uniref:Serine/arginine repetitive matrix protein 1 n=1 Tax=Talaromyces marneffei (strain ATCC 18224 / CBS 334.59 / QM 7333) TaxID=441960 RepID=B6QHZ1_TALMQ|nr:uncharacterized protein EYB26_006954 [Talaromyces marneffei]EEA22986.1 conserved hypothetical protein [Talaromyces marneffei ATCC 18224]KAE8551860.1 hypothetical protein EYB25_005751 [Talaromyces marneffei]QGA19266.1 hypothetical protein EYB26_006954 [Talaromyces marneffei]
MRFEERRGGESYRPSSRYSRSRSPSRVRRPRSPPPPHGPRNRSPPRLGADTWAPRGGHPSERYRSRSPPGFRRSRSPPSYRQPQRARSPLRPRSPRRDRPPSPVQSWRSRSPYNQRSSYDQPTRGVGDNYRAPYGPRSPRRGRPPSPSHGRRADVSPPPRSTFKESDSYGRPPARSRSPHRGGRSPRIDPGQGNRTVSPNKRVPSGYTSALNSGSTSRRSSPPVANERLRIPSSGRESRSPAQDVSSRRLPNDDIAKASSLSTTVSPSSSEFEKPVPAPTTAAHHASQEVVDRTATDRDRPGRSRSPRSHRAGIVSDDRDDGLRDSRYNTSRISQDKTFPTAPNGSTSSSSQNRSSNVSLLSAPTKPRGASGYSSRDPTWSASSTPRRAPSTPHAPHAPPTGPRNRYAYSPPAHDLHRASYRHSNNVPVSHQRSTKVNYLATLPTVINGGRLLPLAFDFSIEKRLVNLKADEEKLVEQAVEKQLLKRQGLRDWDRLQRESALNALRSELAEIHLQRMTEEDRLEGSSSAF